MDAEFITNQPLVIDNGSGIMKAGFAGENTPKLIFPSYVGTPKHVRVMAGNLEENETLIGEKARQMRGLLKLRYSMEAPLNPRKNREQAAQIFFEYFDAPAFYVALQGVLALYSNGKTTGVVLDSGDGVSYCIPIFEGFAIKNAIQRLDLAGRDVSVRLQHLLRRSGYIFSTSAERDIVRDIKEKKCYVAADPLKEEQILAEKQNKEVIYMQYKLSDGSILNVGPERFRAPEILFDPTIMGLEEPGIHQKLYDSINICDIDLRKILYDNIFLSGGSTLLTGFPNRLINEMHKLCPKGIHLRVYAPNQRQYSTWMGGSILGTLSSFKNLWISHSEYEENGPNILHKFLL